MKAPVLPMGSGRLPPRKAKHGGGSCWRETFKWPAVKCQAVAAVRLGRQQPGILPCSQRPLEKLIVSILDEKLKSQDDTIDSSVALAAGCKAPGCMARKKHPDPSASIIFNHSLLH
jgi:hypothetical protein